MELNKEKNKRKNVDFLSFFRLLLFRDIPTFILAQKTSIYCKTKQNKKKTYFLAASVLIAGAAETSTSPSSYAMIRMLGAHLQQQQSVAAAAAAAAITTTTPTITTGDALKFNFRPNMTTGCDSMPSTLPNFSMTTNANTSTGPQCQHCGKIYSNASNLRQHIRNVHVPVDKSMWHTCHTCGKKLKTKHYLINHQLQAHGIHQRTGIGGPSSSLSNEEDLMDIMDDNYVDEDQLRQSRR